MTDCTELSTCGMTFRDLARYLGDFALFWPGIAVSAVVALVLAARVARLIHANRQLAWALMMATGIVLVATVTPSREAFLHGTSGSGTCDMSRIGLASLAELTELGPTTLNVLLFVPLGFSLALLPSSRTKTALVLGALVLPLLIETTQLLIPAFDRACQSKDVVDNITGLLTGLAAGAVTIGLLSFVIRSMTEDDRPGAR
jgi:glycopeptide antibiotics resistance protein